MEFQTALVLIIVILLIFGCMNYVGDQNAPVVMVPATPASNLTERYENANLKKKIRSLSNQLKNASAVNPGSIEANAMKETLEGFSVCGGDNRELRQSTDCLCTDSENIEFAITEFGAKGMDYKAFMASQELDPEIIANQKAFVAERTGFTGRTYSPDTGPLETDYSKWEGLRRPEYVKVCSPKQEVDVPENWFKSSGRQLCFKS